MTLATDAQTPWVVPYYLGGPWDGGFGGLEPTHAISGRVVTVGGVYQLEGFRHAAAEVADVTLAMVTPDRAVYRWEVGR